MVYCCLLVQWMELNKWVTLSAIYMELTSNEGELDKFVKITDKPILMANHYGSTQLSQREKKTI